MKYNISLPPAHLGGAKTDTDSKTSKTSVEKRTHNVKVSSIFQVSLVWYITITMTGRFYAEWARYLGVEPLVALLVQLWPLSPGAQTGLYPSHGSIRERQSEAVIRAGSGAPGAELPAHYEGAEWSQRGPQHWLLQQTVKETGQWEVLIIPTTEASPHSCRCGSSTTSIGWITCCLASALTTFCLQLTDCLGCSHPARPLQAINHNNPRKLYSVKQILIRDWTGPNSDQDPTLQICPHLFKIWLSVLFFSVRSIIKQALKLTLYLIWIILRLSNSAIN